ncbi:hypothetical protein ACFWYW_53295 [Nonomuraea sp. NPDC059023]|uniref:hypothetical protein n=1 Tax=unclassified Nonomuraea TaxID=2593643 RepID=UPI00368B1156
MADPTEDRTTTTEQVRRPVKSSTVIVVAVFARLSTPRREIRMLRFHLTAEDPTRLRLAGGPHPFWEISFSLHLLQTREAPILFDPWRHAVRRALTRAGLGPSMAALTGLFPAEGYWPDFLSPTNEVVDLGTGLDQVLSTPRTTLRHQMRLMAQLNGTVPQDASDIANGDVATLKRLGDLLYRYHRIALAPYTGQLHDAFTTERGRRADAVLNGGIEGLLASYPRHHLHWHNGRLAMPSAFDFDFRPDGRPLTLQPSVFCARQPTATADPVNPLIVAYPAPPPLGWLPHPPGQDALPSSNHAPWHDSSATHGQPRSKPPTIP